MALETPHEATIVGTLGRIRIESPWTRGGRFTVTPHAVQAASAEGDPGSRPPWRVRVIRSGWTLSQRIPLAKQLARRLRPRRGKSYFLPPGGDPHRHEAIEVMRCVREGRLESAIMPLAETQSIMETMDRLRQAWGVRLSTERDP